MRTKQQYTFYTWYNTVRHSTFDFMKEVKIYCENDTDIHATACTIFRKKYIEETEVEPFSRATCFQPYNASRAITQSTAFC